MKVIITNKATYSREFQYFRRNQYIVLKPRDQVVLENVHDPVEVSYYESLEAHGFSVCFHLEENNTCTSEDTKVQSQEEAATIDLSEFSDDDLKRIIKNLGVETRARARWKLESIVLENLPRDASPSDYLEGGEEVLNDS